jgi:hypothetical protein
MSRAMSVAEIVIMAAVICVSLAVMILRVHSGVGGELRFLFAVQAAETGSQGWPARARVMASRAVRPWFAAESR